MRIAFLVFSLGVSLVLDGCGQSGGPPGCAAQQHPLCSSPLSDRLVGQVTSLADGRIIVRVDHALGDRYAEIPAGAEIGAALGAEPSWDEYEWPAIVVGDEVWISHFQSRWADEVACPDYHQCTASCDVDSACLRRCAQAYAADCGPYAPAQLRDGSIHFIGVNRGGLLDFGRDYLGTVHLPVNLVGDVEMHEACVARFPVPADAVYEDPPTASTTIPYTCRRAVYERPDPWAP